MLVPAIFLALFGLLIGSFASVVAFRLPIGESPLTGRSHCDHCGALVAGYDNIPIVSWVLLRGRCRHCHAPIPRRYPLVELGCAVGFAGAYLHYQDDGAAWVALACVLIAMLAIITLTDLEDQIIPDAVLAPTAVIGLALVAVADTGEIGPHLLAAAIAGGFMLLVTIVYPKGMGMGDVKLSFVLGIFLGRAVAPALLIGFAIGAIFGLGVIARHGSAGRKMKVPFGPFLALGAVISLFAGDQIVEWYLDSFIR